MDYAFLAVGGFLLGAFFYTGYYATLYEPDVKPGYVLLGVGILVSVATNAWVDLFRDISNWFRGFTLLAYLFITAGLTFISRRRHARERTRHGRTRRSAP